MLAGKKMIIYMNIYSALSDHLSISIPTSSYWDCTASFGLKKKWYKNPVKFKAPLKEDVTAWVTLKNICTSHLIQGHIWENLWIVGKNHTATNIHTYILKILVTVSSQSPRIPVWLQKKTIKTSERYELKGTAMSHWGVPFFFFCPSGTRILFVESQPKMGTSQGKKETYRKRGASLVPVGQGRPL